MQFIKIYRKSIIKTTRGGSSAPETNRAIKMKIAENKKFLIVDTEDENKPFSRVYVFIKNSTQVKTYGIFEIEENLYSPFDNWEKEIEIEKDDYKDKQGLSDRIVREINSLAKKHFKIDSFID